MVNLNSDNFCCLTKEKKTKQNVVYMCGCECLFIYFLFKFFFFLILLLLLFALNNVIYYLTAFATVPVSVVCGGCHTRQISALSLLDFVAAAAAPLLKKNNNPHISVIISYF